MSRQITPEQTEKLAGRLTDSCLRLLGDPGIGGAWDDLERELTAKNAETALQTE